MHNKSLDASGSCWSLYWCLYNTKLQCAGYECYVAGDSKHFDKI